MKAIALAILLGTACTSPAAAAPELDANYFTTGQGASTVSFAAVFQTFTAQRTGALTSVGLLLAGQSSTAIVEIYSVDEVSKLPLAKLSGTTFDKIFAYSLFTPEMFVDAGRQYALVLQFGGRDNLHQWSGDFRNGYSAGQGGVFATPRSPIFFDNLDFAFSTVVDPERLPPPGTPTPNPPGVGNPVGAVPEPAAWAMMIGGFGMVGGAMRRRVKVGTTLA